MSNNETLADQLASLGDLIAGIVERPDCPPWLRDRLGDLVADFFNAAHKADPVQATAAQARLLMPAYASIVAAGPA